VAAVPEAVAVLNVVTCSSAPVTHLAIVLAPGMYGTVMNGDLSPTASLALEVGGLVHVVINATADVGYGVGSGKSVQTPVHGQAFVLEGLF